MCCELFSLFGINEKDPKASCRYQRINGAGGDGGVEALIHIDGVAKVGIQVKWFRSSMGGSQIEQIKKSVKTAMEAREALIKAS